MGSYSKIDFKMSIYKLGRYGKMEMLPDIDYNEYTSGWTEYDSSDELKFDPDIHLNLELPKSVSIFTDNGISSLESGCYSNRSSDSKFGHSEVFRIFSDEGAEEARRIAL